MKQRLIPAALLAALCIAVLPCYAQERPAEATPSVPALDSFHEVIFKIWHDAWPNKNAALLRQLLPDVEKGVADVASAPLPGILRDKKAAWEEQVKKLQIVGAEYKTAAEANDDPELMNAAEKLHSQFESMVRTIRPALRELDEFHAALYMLVHHDLPKYDVQGIRSSTAELKRKMAALNAAKLPERLKQKEAAFQAAREKLSASVEALDKSVQSDVEAKIKEGVDAVHSDYQALDRVLQ